MHEKTIKLIYLYNLTNKQLSEVLGCSKGYASNKLNPYTKPSFTAVDHVKLLGYLLTKFKEDASTKN